MSHPKLRWPIDIRLEAIEDQELIVVSCPIGVSPNPLLLIRAVGPILSCFDGQHSVDDMVKKFEQYGIRKDLIQELATLLDQNLFLETPNFFSAQQAIKNDFLISTVRPAALAGLGYATDQAALAKEIDGYLTYKLDRTRPVRDLVGLKSPHIDYRRGHIAYGISYNNLRGASHDLYLLIGTSHQYSRHLFHLTSKDFASPLGTISTDADLVADISASYGKERSFADEILHRREHSLELQLPFLRRIVAQPKILPILVGGFQHMVSSARLPSEFEEYESFIGALAENIQKRLASGRRLCVIAGVDMAHLGRSFGDNFKLSPEFMAQTQSEDLAYLDCIAKQDKIAMFNHIAKDQDARRVCGFPTMYTVIDLFDRLNIKYQADTFDYRQAVDYRTECAVTFAGVGFYRTELA